MQQLLEYSDNYSKTSRGLFQYCREESALNNDGDIVDFADKNITDLFKFIEEQVIPVTMAQKMLK